MKESLLQPIVLVLSFLILYAFLAVGSVAVYAASGAPMGATELLQHIGTVFGDLETLVPAAVIGAVFASLYRVIHKPGNGFFSFLLIFLTSLLLLTGGLAGMKSVKGLLPPAVPRDFFSVREGDLLLLPQGDILVGEVEGNYLRSIAILERGDRAHFGRFDEGHLDPVTGDLHVEGFDPAPSLVSLRENRSGFFVPPEALQGIFRDVQFLSGDLRHRFSLSLSDYSAGAVPLLLLASACWVCARLTRWPLFNAAALLLAFRGVLFAYYVFYGTVFRSVADFLPAGPLRSYAPAALFGLLSLVLLVIDILFVPSERKRLESIDEL